MLTSGSPRNRPLSGRPKEIRQDEDSERAVGLGHSLAQ